MINLKIAFVDSLFRLHFVTVVTILTNYTIRNKRFFELKYAMLDKLIIIGVTTHTLNNYNNNPVSKQMRTFLANCRMKHPIDASCRRPE